ncbi:MAG: hemerythrin domain-containing protein [Bdellovibrio sp.]|nr:hemerythrin domain-containing protein [Bdellovibrio sp.]
MRPTEILMVEHRVIKQVLSCLKEMARQTVKSGSLSRPMAEKVIDFIRTFADHCHHEKEETHLFAIMEARGFSRYQGPTAVMRQEHDFGRNCVKQMVAAMAGASAGEKASVSAFVENANLFADMLFSHIEKEDTRLYPMANNILSADDQKGLLDAFHKVEEHDVAHGTHEKYLAIADELADFYGIPKADHTAAIVCDDTMGCGGCGGH